MDTILEFLNEVKAMLPTVKFMDILDILVVALLIYALHQPLLMLGFSALQLPGR